jgi:hypothetical protein
VHDVAGTGLPESGAHAARFPSPRLLSTALSLFHPTCARQSPGMPSDANRVDLYAQPKHEVFNIDFWFNKLLFSS